MDAVSYSLASKQAQRIEKFIENPDSVSGVLTVPKVIAAGETITIPAGRVAVLPNVQVDGTLNISGEVFVPSGATFGDLESQIALKADTNYVNNKYSGFKNYIINGNFDIWQRGTNQTIHDYGSDDRWFNGQNISTKTHSRVTCTDTERVLFNANYFSRTVVNSVDGGDGYVIKRQSIEDVTRLAGKTITVSFWAKANGNKKLWIEHKQMYGTGGTPSTILVGNNVQEFNLTNTWTKYQYTITLPSIIGKTLGTDGVHTSATELQFWFDVGAGFISRIPTGFQQSGTFDIAQVQLEEGSIATPFEQRPYGLELSLCQRYYEVLGCGIGQVKDASSMILHFSSSEKRVPATAILLNTSPYAESPINIIARNGVSSTIATQMNQNTSKSSGHIVLITGFSSMTAGQSASINAGVIALSAEL